MRPVGPHTIQPSGAHRRTAGGGRRLPPSPRSCRVFSVRPSWRTLKESSSAGPLPLATRWLGQLEGDAQWPDDGFGDVVATAELPCGARARAFVDGMIAFAMGPNDPQPASFEGEELRVRLMNARCLLARLQRPRFLHGGGCLALDHNEGGLRDWPARRDEYHSRWRCDTCAALGAQPSTARRNLRLEVLTAQCDQCRKCGAVLRPVTGDSRSPGESGSPFASRVDYP